MENTKTMNNHSPRWCLLAYCTLTGEVMYRAYTRWGHIADQFREIPWLGYDDSDHMVVFTAYQFRGSPAHRVTTLRLYVHEHTGRIDPAGRPPFVWRRA